VPNVQCLPYGNFIAKVLNKEIDIDTDVIKVALCSNSYTPDRGAHDYYNDLTNELSTAGGYTAGGATLSTKSATLTIANSWGRAHAVSTAYLVGDIVRPSTGNTYVYMASVAGTSAGSAPTWPTVIGATVTDGTVTWTCVGRYVWRFSSDPATWAAPFSAGPFRHAVLYDDSPATTATKPLIAILTYASDQTGSDGNATITPDSVQGWVAIAIP
jgi:hypothetical protein